MPGILGLEGNLVAAIRRRVSGASHIALFSKVQVVETTRTCILLALRKISLYWLTNKIYFMKLVRGKDFWPHGYEKTEHFNVLNLYSGDTQFETRLGHRFFEPEIFVVFHRPSMKMSRQYLY